MEPQSSLLAQRQYLNDLVGVRSFERGDALVAHRPIEVHMQLTSGCNLDCFMCSEHLRPASERHGKHMLLASPELFSKVEREILPYSSRIHFGVGAEPMLSPHFEDFLARSRAMEQSVQLTTNGSRINDERTAALLVDSCSSIEVSVDGASAGTYERIRAGGSFEHLKRGLDRLADQRRRRPEAERPRLTLCMVLMQCNVHELPDYVEWAARLEADVAAWHVIPVTAEGRAESLWDARERSDEWVGKARERAASLGVHVDLPAPFGPAPPPAFVDAPRAGAMRRLRELEAAAGGAENGAHRLRCHMPTLAIYVFYDGRVFPCGNPHSHAKQPMGDLSVQSFAEIWNGRHYRNLRAGLARGDPAPLCQSCPLTHDPAPALQDPFAVAGAADLQLASFYGDRDLAPAADADLSSDAVETLLATGIADHLAALERERRGLREHARNLESEREHLRGHVRNIERILDRIQGRRIYAALCAIKDFVTGRP